MATQRAYRALSVCHCKDCQTLLNFERMYPSCRGCFNPGGAKPLTHERNELKSYAMSTTNFDTGMSQYHWAIFWRLHSNIYLPIGMCCTWISSPRMHDVNGLSFSGDVPNCAFTTNTKTYSPNDILAKMVHPTFINRSANSDTKRSPAGI